MRLTSNQVEALQSQGFTALEEVELVEEDVRFSLPAELMHAPAALTTISAR